VSPARAALGTHAEPIVEHEELVCHVALNRQVHAQVRIRRFRGQRAEVLLEALAHLARAAVTPISIALGRRLALHTLES
jgi:hypothetical protein